jgi:FG-GAP-like repeat
MPTSNITNNSFETATRLTGFNNAPQGGVDQLLNRTDNLADFYRFTTSGSSNLRINLTGITGDVKLSLYKVASDVTPTDANLVALREGSTGRLAESYTSTSDPLALRDVAPGIYYIKVEQAGIPLESSIYSLSVFASTAQDTISALWRNPTGGLEAWQLGSADTPSTLQLIGSGDFDADGIDDILWKDTVKNTFVLWFMENGTVRKSVAEIQDGTNTSPIRNSTWSVVGLDDIDNDGFTDILLRNQTSGEINAWFMRDGKITDAPTVISGLGSDWQIQGFSGSRVLWRNTISGVVTTWVIDRSGRKENRPNSFPLSQEWKVVGFQDFNNDGVADVVWRNSQSESVVLWRMSSDIDKFDPVERLGYALPNDWRISTIADFNGDKRPDILFWNAVSGDIVVWEIKQDVVNKDNQYVTYSDNGTFKNLNIKSDAFDVALARDFDGDQKADVLFREKGTGRTVFWKMDGSVRKSSVFGVDPVPSSSVVPGIDYPGYRATSSLKATTKKLPQFTAGSTSANAFDLGVLDGKGSFLDAIGGSGSSDRQDWYKFKVEVSSLLTGLTLTGANIGSAKVEVYLENSNTPLTEDVWRSVLEIGPLAPPKTYYLKVTPDATKQAIPTPYSLNVTGRLGLTNLKANSITIDKTSLPLDVSSVNNKVTVTAFQLENNGDFAASGVTVGYYLSRDGVLDATDLRLSKASVNFSTNVGTVNKGIAEKVNLDGTTTPGKPTVVNLPSPTITLELPGANDAFWSQSGATYRIIAVVDPDKTVTNESPTKRADNAIASTAFTITKAGGSDLTGTAFSSASSVARTGNASGSFTIANIGGVNFGTQNIPLKVKFYFSIDPAIGINDLFLGEKIIQPTPGIAGGASFTDTFSFALTNTSPARIAYWDDLKNPLVGPAQTQVNGFIGMIIDTETTNILDVNPGNNSNAGLTKDKVAVTVTGL